MQYDAVNENDELYIYSPATGYLKAWSMVTKGEFEGLASLKVVINSEALPGVTEMRINTNTFDVWQADNPVVLKKIADTFIKPEWTR